MSTPPPPPPTRPATGRRRSLEHGSIIHLAGGERGAISDRSDGAVAEVGDARQAFAETHPTSSGKVYPHPDGFAAAGVGVSEQAQPVAERGAGVLDGFVCDSDRHGRMLRASVRAGNRPIRPTQTRTKVTAPHTSEPSAGTRRIFRGC
jgi:hypothetical protein